jgi:chromosome segregation ATPase
MTGVDVTRTLQMIEWLDEERRRDKAALAAMQERVAQQQEYIDTLQKRLGALESDQTVIRSQFMPSAREADMMEQMRREMAGLVESLEAKRLTAEREADRRADLARQEMVRPVSEMREKLTRLERQTTELPAINSETDRLAGTVIALQQRVEDLYKRMEEPERRIVLLDEQRRQDARRLSELESELPEVRKQIDIVRPKVTLLEDLALRNERKIQDIMAGDRDRREQMQAFIDQQLLVQQQHDQQVADLIKRFGEQETTMQRNTERFETWAEAYRDMKRIIEDFNRIADRLEYRINEVSEMQRLSEERFRQEWNDSRAEDQKRWKVYTGSQDEIWRSHDKDFEKFLARMNELAERIPPLHDSLTRLWNLERERARLYRERYQSLLLEFDQPVTSSSQPAVSASSLGSGITPPSLSAGSSASSPTASQTVPQITPSYPRSNGPYNGSGSNGR